jgi:hypothetical protein
LLSDSKNTLVKRAKVFNSTFTFLSTIAIVPAFMVWLARKCDKMTRNARERDKAAEAVKKAAEQQNVKVTSAYKPSQFVSPSSKVNMQGFLAK